MAGQTIGLSRGTELSVALENKPGTLARLCAVLRRAKVDVVAVSVTENSQCSWVRLVVQPAAAAKRALSRANHHFVSRPVLLFTVHHRPGELARLSTRLGKSGVNINYIYGSNVPGAKTGLLVLSTADLARARAALR